MSLARTRAQTRSGYGNVWPTRTKAPQHSQWSAWAKPFHFLHARTRAWD
jgi:hypothetical protein